MNNRTISYSILELAIVSQGQSFKETLNNSLVLAKEAEELGYKRFWFAEHHNSESVGSSATSVLIGYVAENTSTLRVGSGGIMLPNHAPLIIAEQFSTLAHLYPGRIDLGLGRAPGTDQEPPVRSDRILCRLHIHSQERWQRFSSIFHRTIKQRRFACLWPKGLTFRFIY